MGEDFGLLAGVESVSRYLIWKSTHCSAHVMGMRCMHLMNKSPLGSHNNQLILHKEVETHNILQCSHFYYPIVCPFFFHSPIFSVLTLYPAIYQHSGETEKLPALAQQASVNEDQEQRRRQLDKTGEHHKQILAKEVSRIY
jgi:hypothetical protein